jgi:hypothetical protein
MFEECGLTDKINRTSCTCRPIYYTRCRCSLNFYNVPQHMCNHGCCINAPGSETCTLSLLLIFSSLVLTDLYALFGLTSDGF